MEPILQIPVATCTVNFGTQEHAILKPESQPNGAPKKHSMSHSISRASMSRSIKFFFQPVVHEAVYSKPESQGTPLTKGVAGAIGTVPEVFAISPLENIKIAAQLDTEKRFTGVEKGFTQSCWVCPLLPNRPSVQSLRAFCARYRASLFCPKNSCPGSTRFSRLKGRPPKTREPFSKGAADITRHILRTRFEKGSLDIDGLQNWHIWRILAMQ